MVSRGGVASSLALTAPATATAGTPLTFTVTAEDQYDNTVTGYTGTVQLYQQRPGGRAAGQLHLCGGDDGVHTFTGGATLETAGSQR